MTNRKLILTLAKVVIAAAWADGEITDTELNYLKRLLLRLRGSGNVRGQALTGLEWAELNIYLETPVDEAERERLIANLQNELRTGSQKRLALEAIREVLEVDGAISPTEEAVLAEIEPAVKDVSVGAVGAIERLFGARVRERRSAVAEAPNREAYFDDYLHNKVHYFLTRDPRFAAKPFDLTENELRKLGLAGGLLAKIAHIDDLVAESELETMTVVIQQEWDLENGAATFVVEVAAQAVDKLYDVTRMMKELKRLATKEERRQFLRICFAVAAADGQITHAEHEAIHMIARGIGLTHQDFIVAKQDATRA